MGEVASEAPDIDHSGLSHQGSGSKPPTPGHSESTSEFDALIRSGKPDVEVPNHVDFRGAFGRRRTADFGFPGARVKPVSPYRTKRPLRDPGNWCSRACGHFSYVKDKKTTEDINKKLCRECAPKAPSAMPAAGQRETCKVDFPTHPETHPPKADGRICGSMRREDETRWTFADKQRDVYAQDLGSMIDALLDEHTRALQDVIDSMKPRQPNVVRVRDLEKKLDQQSRSQITPFQPPSYTLKTLCQPYQPTYRQLYTTLQRTCDREPSYPYAPPRAAQQLNVGEPGQLAPNINDPKARICASTETIPDLIALIDSFADDLGLDLSLRPDVTENEAFEHAPVQKSSTSLQAHNTSKVIHDFVLEDLESIRDSWFESTMRSLTELLEAPFQFAGQEI